jgi:hypothetical protein
LKEIILGHDAVIFRDFPVNDAHVFEQMLDVAEFPNMGYAGVAAPRNEITGVRVF